MSRRITLFSADDGVHGLELWETDGTAAGTALVKDINPGASSSYPDSLTALGDGRAVFQVDLSTDTTNATAIWVTDGTATGTMALRTVPSELLDTFTALGNGRVMFLSYAAGSTNVENLWSTDGTAAGTVLLKTLSTSPVVSDALALGNGKAVFFGAASSPDETLWATDGTAGGTQALATFGSLSGSFASLGNGLALFAGNDRINFSKTNTGTELWVTDGTAAGTHLVRDIYAGSVSSSPFGLTAFGPGRVLFQPASASGTGVWMSDGTAAGTVLLKAGLTKAFNFIVLNGTTAVFQATDSGHGAELWATDGTAAGTALVKDIAPGTAGFGYPDGREEHRGAGKRAGGVRGQRRHERRRAVGHGRDRRRNVQVGGHRPGVGRVRARRVQRDRERAGGVQGLYRVGRQAVDHGRDPCRHDATGGRGARRVGKGS